jgi:pimeloyl-ACP methyl ester carboxylesterase
LSLALVSVVQAADPAPHTPPPTPPDTAEIRALPGYQAERMKSLSFPGEAYVFEAGRGDGRPVLLIHGIARDGAHDWDSLVPVLARDRRVIAFDLPGFGRSSKERARYRPMAYASFVDEVLRERVAGDFDVVAHSMGVSIALEVAARHPDHLRRLVLADAAAILHGHALSVGQIERGQEKLGAFGKLLNPVRNLSYDMMGHVSDDLVHRVALGMKGESVQSAAAALMAHDSNPALDAVRAPTLVIWGEKDEVVSPRGAWILTSRIPGARLAWIPEAGHTPMRDAPEAFDRLVVGWLAGDDALGRAFDPPDATSTRDGVCKRHRGSMVFTGSYRKIHIEGCKEIVLRGVRAQEIDLHTSNVVAEDLVVTGGPVAMNLWKSRLKMSGGVLDAEVPLRLLDAEVDLAGVTLRGGRVGVEAKGSAKVLCSLCRIEAGGQEMLLHGFETMRGGTTLGPELSEPADAPASATP